MTGVGLLGVLAVVVRVVGVVGRADFVVLAARARDLLVGVVLLRGLVGFVLDGQQVAVDILPALVLHSLSGVTCLACLLRRESGGVQAAVQHDNLHGFISFSQVRAVLREVISSEDFRRAVGRVRGL